MSDRLQKILLYGVASPLTFLVSLLLGAYWTFPYDQLRDFIVQQAETNGGIQLEIQSLEPSWVTGVEATGVRVILPSEDPSERPAELLIREVSARVSLLSLLSGTTEVSFEAELDAGRIEGVYAQSEEQTHVEATLSDVDLRRIGPLRSAIGIPITGRASGTIDLTIASEASATQGSVDLTVRGASIADGRTPIRIEGLGQAGLTLERMSLGDLRLRMGVERGVGRIEELHADGEDAELRGTGTVRLMQPLRMSGLDLLLRVSFKQRYRESNDRMRGLFTLLDINPQVRPARTDDGSLQWRISGSFGGRFRMVPSGRTPMAGAD